MNDVELGCRSPLVMAKLGYDLRTCYQEVVDQPMPERLQSLCEELLGYASFDEVDDERTSGNEPHN